MSRPNSSPLYLFQAHHMLEKTGSCSQRSSVRTITHIVDTKTNKNNFNFPIYSNIQYLTKYKMHGAEHGKTKFSLKKKLR